jgi:ribonuclease P protein component
LSRFAFPKADRILKRSEFIAFRRFGRKISSRYFFAVVQQNKLTHCRLGITVTRKVGKAATRNRIKRRIREYFRLNRHRIDGNWDIHLIVKKEAGDIDFAQASSSLDRIFNQLGGPTKG